MSKELLSKIERVLSENRGAMHVDDISLKLVDTFPNIDIDLNRLPGKVSSALAGAVKKKDDRFSKLKNRQGGFKRGMYRLKRRVKMNKPVQLEMPIVTTQYTGSAGEHAVLGELLFWGFNASSMAVDDGIDVVASKDNKYFHIQVKTANPSKKGSYQFNISRDRFDVKHGNSMFYVFVMRRSINSRHVNDFAIMPSSEIKRLIDSERIKAGSKLNVRIEKGPNEPYMMNNSENVTWCVNNWAAII